MKKIFLTTLTLIILIGSFGVSAAQAGDSSHGVKFKSATKCGKNCLKLVAVGQVHRIKMHPETEGYKCMHLWVEGVKGSLKQTGYCKCYKKSTRKAVYYFSVPNGYWKKKRHSYKLLWFPNAKNTSQLEFTK